MRDALAQLRARTLRNRATDAELRLWQQLRHRQLGGFRFRRQVPIHGYVADFACPTARLVIELDGGRQDERRAYDERRDALIAAEGYRVLRCWDNQVLQEMDAVLEDIVRALSARQYRPLPDPPPR